ncbi:unnamed protein product [Caenorhabditis sp. 36 PRJEB53466]|nr:unnamed protein product [Caenorhabditis sp. 36 PRJEB53466]
MTGWTDLPPKTKARVVGRLDLISRTALKSCSRAERALVDSTPLFLPRVRFVFQESSALIVAYSSIERLLRLQFCIDRNIDKGVDVFRSDNLWTSGWMSKVRSDDVLRVSVSVLKCLFASKNVEIGVLEWESAAADREMSEKWAKRIMKQLKGAKFRTRKMAFNWRFEEATEIFKNCCVWKELEEVEIDGIQSRDEIDGTYTVDRLDNGGYFGKMKRNVTIFLHGSSLKLPMIAEFADKKTKRRGSDSPMHTTRGTFIKSYLVPDRPELLFWFCQSRCGSWIDVVPRDIENEHMRTLEDGKCPLGWYCESCSDRFEFVYHRDLPRRALTEPTVPGIWMPTTPNLEEHLNALRKTLVTRSAMLDHLAAFSTELTDEYIGSETEAHVARSLRILLWRLWRPKNLKSWRAWNELAEEEEKKKKKKMKERIQ